MLLCLYDFFSRINELFDWGVLKSFSFEIYIVQLVLYVVMDSGANYNGCIKNVD